MVGTKLLITLPTVVKLGDETPSANCRNRSFGSSHERFVAPAVRHKCRRVRAPMPNPRVSAGRALPASGGQVIYSLYQ